jgi:ubiquitin-protein ligase
MESSSPNTICSVIHLSFKDDPLNNEAANLWKTNELQALAKAKEFTNKFAK